MSLELSQSHPQNTAIFEPVRKLFAKLHSQDLSLFNLIQSKFCANSCIPRAFVNTASDNCLTLWLLVVVMPVKTNKMLDKKLKRKCWGMRCLQGAL